jgi:hypothetical protein
VEHLAISELQVGEVLPVEEVHQEGEEVLPVEEAHQEEEVEVEVHLLEAVAAEQFEVVMEHVSLIVITFKSIML